MLIMRIFNYFVEIKDSLNFILLINIEQIVQNN